MKTFEPDDPMALVGVRLEATPGDEALTEMAWAIVEEYTRLGWKGDDVLRLFRTPAFRMAHRVLEARGEAFVTDIIAQADAIRRQVAERGERR